MEGGVEGGGEGEGEGDLHDGVLLLLAVGLVIGGGGLGLDEVGEVLEGAVLVLVELRQEPVETHRPHFTFLSQFLSPVVIHRSHDACRNTTHTVVKRTLPFSPALRQQ